MLVIRYSPVELLYDELLSSGACIILHDPYVAFWQEKKISIACQIEDLEINSLDVVIIAAAHRVFLSQRYISFINNLKPKLMLDTVGCFRNIEDKFDGVEELRFIGKGKTSEDFDSGWCRLSWAKRSKCSSWSTGCFSYDCRQLFRAQSDAYFAKIVAQKTIKVVRGDFTDAASFARLEDDYDQVYMFASVVGVEYTHSIPDELVRINTALILNTLEWLKKSRCRKVLFASTSECYAGTVEKFDYVIPTNENVPLYIRY